MKASLNISQALNYAMQHFVELFFLVVVTYLLYWLLRQKSWKKLPPGPTGLPFVGCVPLLGKKPYKTLAQMRKKYGDIIGLKLGFQYTVVFHEYNVLKEVLCHPGALARSDMLFESLPLGFIANNGPEWQEQRKFCMSTMRNLGLGKGPWSTLTKESTDDFVKGIQSLKGQPFDISELLGTTLSNNILSLLIGRRSNTGRTKQETRAAIDFAATLDNFGPTVAGSLIPGFRKVCEYFGLLGYDKAADSIRTFFRIIREEKLKRDGSQDQNHDAEDFMHLYQVKMKQMSGSDVGHFFSEKNMYGNIAALVIGATDTLFASIMWLLLLMVKYPEVQKKVQAELDEVIGRDGTVTYEERAKVPYTFAVLQEAQRVSSIVPLASMRRVNDDFEISGYTIPKNSIIVANTWCVHNDPDVWKDPENFRPERFLTNDVGNKTGDVPRIFSFSVGKRNCPGETVAWMVLLIFFTTVMQKFNISAPPSSKIEFITSNGIVEHLKPQLLCFVERP